MLECLGFSSLIVYQLYSNHQTLENSNLMHSKTKMSLAIHEGNFQPKIATEKGKEKPIFSKNTAYVI